MKPTELKPQDIEIIFYASRLYGGRYDGDSLQAQRWEWPKGWLSKRRNELKKERGDDFNHNE